MSIDWPSFIVGSAVTFIFIFGLAAVAIFRMMR